MNIETTVTIYTALVAHRPSPQKAFEPLTYEWIGVYASFEEAAHAARRYTCEPLEEFSWQGGSSRYAISAFAEGQRAVHIKVSAL